MIPANLYAAAAAGIFFWCGSVTAISFLEAWVKFSAPGVTVPIGLSIGRVVFPALNKLEWLLAVGCLACICIAGGRRWTNAAWLAAAVAILLIDTVWLLPMLDRRARAWLADQPPPRSSTHFLFVAAELLKLALLVVAGIKLLKLL